MASTSVVEASTADRRTNPLTGVLARVPGPLLLAAVTIAYLAVAQYVHWLDDPVNLGAGFWPAAGISLGLLLLVEPRRWGWILVGVAGAEMGGDLVRGHGFPASLAWTVANVAEPVVAAVLLRRWGNASGALVPVGRLARFLVAGVLIGPVVGATIGAIGTVHALGHVGWWTAWPKWIVGDGLGVLVIAPLLLCWREPRIARSTPDTVALAIAVPLVSVAAFHTWGPSWEEVLPYLVIPLATWAALRHGSRGAAITVAVVTLVATSLTATGDGPFASGLPADEAVVLLQVFLVIVAVTTFLLAAVVEDLVDRREVEARLAHQAATDGLTGLPNRAALMAALAARSASGGGELSVFVCDLDHLKVVNDGLGHQAGDEVLVEVARRMERAVRPGDLVVRLSGDEFVVVVEGPPNVLDVMSRRLIEQVADPLTLSSGARITPSISVGIAHGTDAAVLLPEADAALYRAKELGRGRVHRFDDDLRQQVDDRLLIQTGLVDALAVGDITCTYQAEIVVATGHLFGFEALARWRHPTRGSIPPARFVPVIEDIGGARQLFAHVLADALVAQDEWEARLDFRPPVAVNLSASLLADGGLAALVADALERRGAPAATLWIEVTETAFAEGDGSDALLSLHDLGVRLAIDDFGTGWSSMARLAAFPWDLLKIDQSFVAALGTNPQAEQVVRSTIAMAHALGILTTAEGVETAEQFQHLGALGCDLAQGHLFARPVAAGEAVAPVAPGGRWTGPGVVPVEAAVRPAGPRATGVAGPSTRPR